MLKKIIPMLAILFVFLLPTSVFASEVGWPVETETVQAEEIPSTDGSLSAIDDGTTGMQDYEVFGEEYDLVNRLSSGNTTDTSLDEAARIYSSYSDVVPTVTTDQMVEWILKKGNELISILQIFAQPFAIIIFIVSCAICLIGSLTKGNMAGKGLIGMIASAILYACALYAPTIVNIVVGWASS